MQYCTALYSNIMSWIVSYCTNSCAIQTHFKWNLSLLIRIVGILEALETISTLKGPKRKKKTFIFTSTLEGSKRIGRVFIFTWTRAIMGTGNSDSLVPCCHQQLRKNGTM